MIIFLNRYQDFGILQFKFAAITSAWKMLILNLRVNSTFSHIILNNIDTVSNRISVFFLKWKGCQDSIFINHEKDASIQI